MDKIILPRMEFYGYHGVFAQEKKVGQPFIVAVEMALDLVPAGMTDDLTKTVNYAEAYQMIKAITEGKSFDLIEALAHEIAMCLLEKYPLEQVRVQVDKPAAPLPGGSLAARVEILRKKNEEEHTVYLSLGSNLGDKEGYMKAALKALGEMPGTRVTGKSSLYLTEPFGYKEQDFFLNAVVRLATRLSPQEVLFHTQEIENHLGRKRLVHWGPRTMDIDILLYDREEIEEENLIVPHAQMELRRFVLVPLMEIKDKLVLPGLGSLAQVLDKCPDTGRITLVSPPDQW